MPLVSRNHVRITRLRFPFAVRVDALRGSASLRDINARREVRPGDPFVVPAFAHFDCELPATCLQPCAITLTAVPDGHCPRMAAIHYEKHWSRALAWLVFEQPALAWNAALLSEHWQVSQRLVRARLFAEGEAMQALVREQRAAQAFYALASCVTAAASTAASLERVAAGAGLRSGRAFVQACRDLFGVDPVRLLTLSATPVRSTALAGAASWTGWPAPAAA
jgi:AraC-like DNA-binding protein